MKDIFLIPILVLTIFFQTIISFEVIKKVNVVRFADEATYLKRGLEFYHLIFENKNNSNIFKIMNEIFKIQREAIDRPPFLFLVQAFGWKFLKIFNIWDEHILVLLVNMFFLLILVLSCYGIGTLLFNKTIGFVNALVLSMTPIIFAYTRIITTDFSLTSMVCFSFYLLFKTNNFQSRFFSICLGIVVGLSQLTRETFFIYFTLPFLYYIYQSLKRCNKKEIFYNILITLILSIVITGIVFFNPESFYAYKKYLQLSQLVNYKTYFHYYITNFHSIFGKWLFISTILIFIFSIVQNKKINKILLSWFLTPIIIFSMMQNRAFRFIMPVIPAYFLIVGQGLLNLFESNMKKIFINIILICVTIVSILQYFIINFNYYGSEILFLPWGEYEFVIFIGMHDAGKRKYLGTYKNLIEIFKNEKFNDTDDKILLSFFGISEILTPLKYKFVMENIPIKLNTAIFADLVDAPIGVNWEEEVLLRTNYFVDKVGGFMGNTGSRENIREKLVDAYLKHKEQFELIGKIRVEEDDSYILVYKNKKTTS